MTKHCPTCNAEFQDHVKVCPDDSSTLRSGEAVFLDQATHEDIYAASNEVESERIIAFLVAAGLEAYARPNQISVYPTLGDTHYVISVAPKHKQKAIQQIKDARHDQVISDLGDFLQG